MYRNDYLDAAATMIIYTHPVFHRLYPYAFITGVHWGRLGQIDDEQQAGLPYIAHHIQANNPRKK